MFDCGEQSLNKWLYGQARQSMESRDAMTTLLLDDDANPGGDAVIVGYYCLSPGELDASDVPDYLIKGARSVVPVIRMGRLAVDLGYRMRQRGLGSHLLRHAVRSAVECNIAGRLLVVEALHERALGFYLKFGFIQTSLPLQAVFDLRIASELIGKPADLSA